MKGPDGWLTSFELCQRYQEIISKVLHGELSLEESPYWVVFMWHKQFLSFGALGVNDVIAAVVCVLLTEYVTKFYYSRPKVTFPIALLNNFKIGFTYGLFIDAFKLAS